MTKTTSETNDGVTVVPTTVAESPILLDEFCRELSTTDKRVALIAGFHADEVRSCCIRATRERFAADFAAYINRPVA